ncbi:hypothetical protein ACSHWG_01090 [Leucobacter sp. Z1108]|uniref:hypothetical protein n=1 Tax=Leucobacter sp. Z1108 TaxID=3439066 RepID=UPI003F3B5092
MSRELRRREARKHRVAPVTRTVAKQRALAFIAGVALGTAGVLAAALLASVP